MLQYAVALALTQGSRKAAETIFSLGSKYLAVLDIPPLWSVNNCEMISCLVFNIHIASRFSFLPMDWFLGIYIQNSDDVASPGNISFMHPSGVEHIEGFDKKEKKRLILHLSALAIASFLSTVVVNCTGALLPCDWIPIESSNCLKTLFVGARKDEWVRGTGDFSQKTFTRLWWFNCSTR